MTFDQFKDYLTENGCGVVRVANKYHVMRNNNNGKMSGLPHTDPPLPATVCRTCKNLGVPAPQFANEAQGLIDDIDNHFNNGEAGIPRKP